MKHKAAAHGFPREVAFPLVHPLPLRPRELRSCNHSEAGTLGLSVAVVPSAPSGLQVCRQGSHRAGVNRLVAQLTRTALGPDDSAGLRCAVAKDTTPGAPAAPPRTGVNDAGLNTALTSAGIRRLEPHFTDFLDEPRMPIFRMCGKYTRSSLRLGSTNPGTERAPVTVRGT